MIHRLPANNIQYICIRKAGIPTMSLLASGIQMIHNSLLYKCYRSEYRNSDSELLPVPFWMIEKHICAVSGIEPASPALLVGCANHCTITTTLLATEQSVKLGVSYPMFVLFLNVKKRRGTPSVQCVDFFYRVKIFLRSLQIVFSNNEASESDKIGIWPCSNVRLGFTQQF